jgi:multiple sugar transport system permease protein
MKSTTKEAWTGLFFVSLWIIGFLVFTLYPIISSFYYSLTEYKVISPAKWIGFKNFINLFSDKVFLKALLNTLYMILLGIPITTFVTISVALILDNKKLSFTSGFRVVFFIPTLVPTVISCLLWVWMMQPNSGIINHLLGYIGIQGPSWLGSPFWVKPAFILMMIWTCGNTLIIYLAGLKDIPDSLYESASIDGAGFLKQVFSITIPLLRPTILYNVVISIISIFQWFAEPYIITQGGPNNETMFYSLYLYRNAFSYFKMGYASAMAWILLIISLTMVLVLFKVLKFGTSDMF